MPEIKVVAGVIEREGLIMIARRAPHKHLGGKWEFPGGKLEAGESPEGALERELMEEFGIQVRVGQFIAEELHRYPGVGVWLSAYHVEYVSGQFVPDSHDLIEWVTPADCFSYDMAEADWFIVRTLCGRA